MRVVGVSVQQNADGRVRSMGIQCALCHSTVDDSFAPGIGRRLDGWANQRRGDRHRHFQADRAPDHRYRTTPLQGLWTHQKGGFFHDGRFPTLLSVVQHYNAALGLNRSSGQMNDLVEYLKSLQLRVGKFLHSSTPQLLHFYFFATVQVPLMTSLSLAFSRAVHVPVAVLPSKDAARTTSARSSGGKSYFAVIFLPSNDRVLNAAV